MTEMNLLCELALVGYGGMIPPISQQSYSWGSKWKWKSVEKVQNTENSNNGNGWVATYDESQKVLIFFTVRTP